MKENMIYVKHRKVLDYIYITDELILQYNNKFSSQK